MIEILKINKHRGVLYEIIILNAPVFYVPENSGYLTIILFQLYGNSNCIFVSALVGKSVVIAILVTFCYARVVS